ncbi:MAG: hypothetical protein HY000_05330 [Planctomycetes bacterium]|nr:hypothetical protein [Planctomycetota bacterium]
MAESSQRPQPFNYWWSQGCFLPNTMTFVFKLILRTRVLLDSAWARIASKIPPFVSLAFDGLHCAADK